MPSHLIKKHIVDDKEIKGHKIVDLLNKFFTSIRWKLLKKIQNQGNNILMCLQLDECLEINY